MGNINVYFGGLAADKTKALHERLRFIAEDLGYTSVTAATKGRGNVARLLEAIDAGEVILLLFPPEQRPWMTTWIEAQLPALRDSDSWRDHAIAEALETIAQALDESMERQYESD